MLMRRMQGRRSLLQIGPTSRTRDSVWFHFPCRDFGPIRNLNKLYLTHVCKAKNIFRESL
jgi:hypothetical protein